MKRSCSVACLLLFGALGLQSVRAATIAETYDQTADWTIGSPCTVGKPLTLTIPESGEVYCKLSGVSKGGEYTFSSSCGNVFVEVVYTYSWVDRYEEGSDTHIDTYIEYDSVGELDEESDTIWFIKKENWDDLRPDPSSETEKPVTPKAYYAYVYGESGTELVVSSSKGIVTPPKSGSLTVHIKGADTTWSLKGQAGSYTNGQTIAIAGEQTVVYSKVSGLTTPANETVRPYAEGEEIEVTGVYSDTFDPKDDTVAGATKLTVSAKTGTAARTLYEEDPADHFAFAAKEGSLYSFSFAKLEGAAEMTLFKKGSEDDPVTNGVTVISALPLKKGDYILRVDHGEDAGDATYTLEYTAVNVGTVGFAKTAVSAKKSAGSVSLTVNRSSAEGKVRVLYGTVNGTAKPGVDYYAQQGELVWENGDKKAKTITVRLIPEAFAETDISRRFAVLLEPVAAADLEEGEYQAVLADGKAEAIVTVTETKAKAPAEPQPAKVTTEKVPLETGTYQGVVEADEGSLTNGFPALASVTFTAKDATKKALSAKVILGGKTYSFAADTWIRPDAATAVAEMTLLQKVDKTTTLTNALTIAVATGETAEEGDWTNAVAYVSLVMNVPDAKGKGYQTDVVYTGELYRDNSKIQGYLNEVVDAVGYYTVALAPTDAPMGAPSGNGYLTLTIDNKGKAKVAGLLANGTTKPSYSSFVTVCDDGETLLIPVFAAKSPYCFGGTLRLVRGEDGKYVVDSLQPLVWNNDDALLTYDGEEGWSIEIDPVGGYFNTVNNLQTHYLTCAFGVSTADVEDLPEEVLSKDYAFVTSVRPDATPVTLAGNTLSTEKRTLLKDGKLVDLAASVNPCNVQVKLVRATGLVSGSFSAWAENEAGTAQKEITGLKHNGILVLSRGASAALDSDVLTAGFFTQTATLTYEDAAGKTKTRKYTASNPFNILAVDQGEPDWYADDWGEKPEK